MSQDKVTPIPHAKGTPKRMRPVISRVTYYLVALVGIIHLLVGIYLYYEIGVLSRSASVLTLQPASLDAVIEFFSGVFAVVAAFGLRRLAYWGSLSIAVFGVFEIWNSSPVTQVIQFGLVTTLGVTVSNPLTNLFTLFFQALGILILVLSAFSFLGIRRHRRVASELKA
jgi:hypothetical protein